MSSTTPPKARKARASGRKRTWRLNLRALAILSVGALLSAGTLAAALWSRSGADHSWVVRARQQIEAGQGGLALSFLNEAIRRDPRDVEALDLKADLLTQAARNADDLTAAIQLSEQALRLDPDGPNSQATRRRLIGLHLRVAPTRAEPKLRYEVADILARELVARSPDDAEALRLHAQVQEGLAEYGQDVEALDRAIALYEQARQRDPKQVGGAERLAWLYREKKDDPQRGRLVLDDLLAASPDSPEVRLARQRFDAAMARDAETRGDRSAAETLWGEADAELERAVALAPESAEVRLQAADYQLRRGRPEAALRQIEALSREARQDPRARALEGLAHLQRNQTGQAIEDWRRGLVDSGGTDGELTWRLAFVLLQNGRLEEAAPLVEQFRRLDGREEPGSAYLLLKGLEQLRRNQPAEALKPLQRARRGAPAELVAQLEFTTGQCLEALRDPAQALEHYQRAIEADPRLLAPQLARIRLIQARRPEEARQEIRRALERLGDEPSLLINLARLEFHDQVRLPADRRDWTEVRGLVERASRLAPAASGLVQLQADLLRVEGRIDEASALLEQASRHRKADVEIWLARALLLQRQGRYESALAVLEQAMAPEAAGDQAPLRIARARLLSLRGRGQEAREQLVANLEVLPSDQRPDVWKALGDLYAEQRDPEEARRAYGQWANALPDDPLPRLFLLELALDQGDRQDADEQIAQLKRNGGENSLYWRIARVQELFRPRPGESAEAVEVRLREAESLITAIEAESRQERFGPMLRGQLAELRGQKAEAAAAFEEALRRDGGPIVLGRLVRLYQELDRPADLSRLRREHAQDLPTIDRELAEAALQRGDHDRAVKLAHQVVEDDPGGLETRVWQGRLLSAAGRPEEALASLRELVAKQPGQIGPRLALVLFLAGQGRADEAREAVERITREVKDLDQPEFTFAQCWRLAGDRERADAAFQAALAKWPDDAQVLREAVNYFENSDQTDRAETLLREARKRDPSRRWITRTLALLRSNHPGDLDAWREARTLIGEEADAPEDRLARGIILARGPEPADHRQAIAILDPLLRDLPADVPTAGIARSVLRQLYLREGRPAEAARVAAIDARDPEATAADLVRSAELFLAADQVAEAEPFIERLEAEAPDDPATPLLRARLLKLQDRAAEAVALLLKAFDAQAVVSDDPAVGRRYFDALLAIDPKAAEDLGRRLAEARPHLAWLPAAALARQGEPEKALALYRDAAAKAEPADLRAIAQGVVGLALETAAPSETLSRRADEALDAVLAREPKAVDLRLARAGLRHAQGRYAEEIQIYEALFREGPADLSFLNNLAWTLCEALDQPEKALDWINRAIDGSKAVPAQLHDTRGVILTRLGRFDEAIADLERASQGTDSGPALAHLARAYHQADRPDAFQATLERIRAVRLQPEDLEPRDRRELVSLLFGESAPGRP